MIGDVSALDILDAGCGTGYLSVKLADLGGNVVGIDFSPEMIAMARVRAPSLDFRVDSCSVLKTIPDQSIDIVVSNYVLMDVADLENSVNSLFRILRPGGKAVVVFSHPCFPQADAVKSEDRKEICYHWPFSYFTEMMRVDPPWGHFKEEFIRFHRPLSRYWKAFKAAGFFVEDFDEPVISPGKYAMVKNERSLNNNLSRPYSVAFKLHRR